MAFVHCGVCEKWVIDTNTGDYYQPTGQPEQRPIPPNCDQCAKGQMGFKGRQPFEGRMLQYWDGWCFLKNHGILPDAGGMADQEGAFVDAVRIFDGLFAERERSEAERMRAKNGAKTS